MTDKPNMLEAALKYRELGFSVIPVGKDKKPLIDWKRYQTEPATEEEIRAWATQYPDMNIAAITGAVSGIVVVDIEKGGSTAKFPATVCSKTGGEGWHLFYKHPGRTIPNSARKIAELTDVRGDGGYVVLPPSLHASGNRYEWSVAPEDSSFEEMPYWVSDEKSSEYSAKDWAGILNSTIPEGSRNMSAAQVAGKLLHHLPPEAWSLGWFTLRAWNEEFAKPPLPRDELRRVWLSISKREKAVRAERENEELVLPKKRVAVCPKPETEMTVAEWRNLVAESFPDLVFAAECCLSIIVQMLIKEITNPFALVLVDMPSSGKTITLNFFCDIPELTYASDKFTPASFVSNASNVSKKKLAQIDLLPRLQYKTFMIRDLATLFSKREDDLTESLGILTRVLDGEGLNTDSGVHGQREYKGEYLFMLLAASTPIQPRVWKTMGNLGSRLFFLTMNTRDKGEDELISQLQSRSYKEKETAIRVATRDLLYTLWNTYSEGVEWDKSKDDENALRIIARCALVLARLRGVVNVWHDEYNDSYSYGVPTIEKPDRINQLFYNFARGHALTEGRTYITADDVRYLIEFTLDSASIARANLFKKLLQYGGVMRTIDVEYELNVSKTTALKEMKTLNVLGLCTLQEVGEMQVELASDLNWFLSEEAQNMRAKNGREVVIEIKEI